MYTLHLIRTFVLWKVFPSCSSGYFSYLYTYLISAESSQAWLLATSWGDGFHWLNSLWAWSWEGRPGPATHSSCGNSRLLRLPVVKLKFKDYQKNNMGTACGCFASGYFLTTLFLKTRRRGNPGSHCGKVRELLSSASAPSAASLLVISEGVLRSQRTAGGAGELQPTPVLWSSPRRGTQHPGSPCWRDPLPLAPGRCVGPPGGGEAVGPRPLTCCPGRAGLGAALPAETCGAGRERSRRCSSSSSSSSSCAPGPAALGEERQRRGPMRRPGRCSPPPGPSSSSSSRRRWPGPAAWAAVTAAWRRRSPRSSSSPPVPPSSGGRRARAGPPRK